MALDLDVINFESFLFVGDYTVRQLVLMKKFWLEGILGF
jgi:hypothetical protein